MLQTLQMVDVMSAPPRTGLSSRSILSDALVSIRNNLPDIHDNRLSVFFCLLCSLMILAHVPWELGRAERADAKLGHVVPIIGDAHGYHIRALNMIHGYGYSEGIHLPLEQYNLDLTSEAGAAHLKRYREHGPDQPNYSFGWAPGTSLMLSAVYFFFGGENIVAQRMMAALLVLTALSLVLTGHVMAGWLGSLAGLLAGVYHLHYFPGAYNFELILSENPAAFWMSQFGLLFALYLKKEKLSLLILAAMALAAMVLTRVNFLPAAVLLGVYLILVRHSWKRALILLAIVLVPVILWSTYASAKTHTFVLVNAQGSTLFAETNNLDTLEGIGPEHWNRGGWNPGFYRKEDGKWGIDGHNQVRAGESGWAKGFAFWKANWFRLHRLFYTKLYVGFWYNSGQSVNWVNPEGYPLIAIGYLLVAVGFLQLPRGLLGLQLPFHATWLLPTQLALVSVLFELWNRHGLPLVLLIWALLFFLSMIPRSHDQYSLRVQNPAWLLAFVASHAITTLVYYGKRFHQPIDPSLMLVCFMGTLLLLYESLRRNLWVHIGFLLLLIQTVIYPFCRSLVG